MLVQAAEYSRAGRIQIQNGLRTSTRLKMRNLLQLLRLILESKGKLRVILRSLGFIQIIKDPSANGNIP